MNTQMYVHLHTYVGVGKGGQSPPLDFEIWHFPIKVFARLCVVPGVGKIEISPLLSPLQKSFWPPLEKPLLAPPWNKSFRHGSENGFQSMSRLVTKIFCCSERRTEKNRKARASFWFWYTDKLSSVSTVIVVLTNHLILYRSMFGNWNCRNGSRECCIWEYLIRKTLPSSDRGC